MAVSKSYQSPILWESLLQTFEGIKFVEEHAFRTGQVLAAWLEQQREAVAAVGVPTRQHPRHTLLLIPLVQAYVAFHLILIKCIRYDVFF